MKRPSLYGSIRSHELVSRFPLLILFLCLVPMQISDILVFHNVSHKVAKPWRKSCLEIFLNSALSFLSS